LGAAVAFAKGVGGVDFAQKKCGALCERFGIKSAQMLFGSELAKDIV
jgi:hypothetical protein